MKQAQDAFESLVTKDFSTASFDDVKTVALAMWHENFVPRVDHLTDFSAQAAGYVVDKLMRFNCVSQELKRRLCELVARLRATVKISPVEVKGCDKLAQQWGLMCDLKLQVRQLLEFQTRHYSHV